MKKTRRSRIAVLLGCAFLLWTLCAGAGVALAAVEKPEVSVYFAEVEDDYVILEGVVDYDGGDDITEYGFYYGEDEDDMDKVRVGYEIGEGRDFSKRLYVDDELEPDTTYYFAAYAKNSAGTSYSRVRTFETGSSSSRDLPTVITEDADVYGTEVVLYGSIDDDGGYDITEHGFYYGTSQSSMTKKARAGYYIDEGDDFDYELDGLEEDTKYYYKAYARNSEGIAYGQTRSFTTDEDEGGSGRYSDRPEVTTKTPLAGKDFVEFYGVVDDRGRSDIREYGFYWGYNSDPSNKEQVGTKIDEDRTFSFELDDYDPARTYYVKAYARNSSGTSYGNTVKVAASQTGNLATLTVQANNVISGAATLMGTVVSNGGSTITEYGFLYQPLGGAEKQVRFFGSIPPNAPFQYYLGGLTNGNYSLRSYAVNSAGTAYSQPLTFTVGSGGSVVTPPPTVPVGKAPVVLVSTPVQGMTISRGQTMEIASSSTDDVKVEAMGLYINGVQRFRCTGSSFQYWWNTAGVAPGTYTIRITSWDGILVGERLLSVNVI